MRLLPLSNSLSFAMVDDDLYDFLDQWTWKLVGKGYVARKTTLPGRICACIYLHRVVMGITDRSLRVDHRNHNPLDCQRHNLRQATQTQNLGNARKSSRTGLTSIFKGVSLNRTSKKPSWRANITCNKQIYRLGHFPTQEQAALAYNQKASELFGEFALLNNIHPNLAQSLC